MIQIPEELAQGPSVPFIDMGAVNAPARDELRAAFERVLTSSQFVGGEEVSAFEAMLANYVGTSYAIGVNSGTAALHLALLAAGIGAGDEVVIPANTFFATAEAVVAAGATPVLADCDPSTALMDPNACEAAITGRTAAIIPVHLYGQPVDMDRYSQIARQNSLFLLEDNAQAIGGKWNDRQAGSLGDAAAFSFYPGKNLGALGEGGAITTSDENLARKIDHLRSHGSLIKYQHEYWGWNERLHGMQGAFLAAKLPHLDRQQQSRNTAVELYCELTEWHPHIEWFETHELASHVWHLLVVQVPNRDKVLETMVQNRVTAAIHYPVPIHLTPAAGGELGKEGDFPHSERLAKSILSLPLYAGISDEQVERAANVLMHAVNGNVE